MVFHPQFQFLYCIQQFLNLGLNPPPFFFSEGPPSFWSKFKMLPPSFWEPSKLVHVNCKKHFKIKVSRFTLSFKSHLSSNQVGAYAKVFIAIKFTKNNGYSDITIFQVNSVSAILAAFYVRAINCCLMVYIDVGWINRILNMRTSKWSDAILESYFRRFCKHC